MQFLLSPTAPTMHELVDIKASVERRIIEPYEDLW